jgi:hypothetical protein
LSWSLASREKLKNPRGAPVYILAEIAAILGLYKR